MPNYRLYCLAGGKIIRGEWMEAADDAAAIRRAAETNPDTDCEVWLGNRLVARVPADGEPVIGHGPDPV